ncbi:unnamed protein product [Arabidopsis halleri]
MGETVQLQHRVRFEELNGRSLLQLIKRKLRLLIQGLRKPLTIPYLKNINCKYKIDIMFLVEIKNKDNYVHNLDMYITEGPTTFCLTYVYGNPERKPRQYMWQMIENLVKGGLDQSKPRLVLGDFNEIKHNLECWTTKT